MQSQREPVQKPLMPFSVALAIVAGTAIMCALMLGTQSAKDNPVIQPYIIVLGAAIIALAGIAPLLHRPHSPDVKTR